MFERLTNSKRIEHAKSKTAKVLDHFLYLVELHENNSFVVYSSALSSQIPKSYAANGFNVFRRGMHQFEIIRLCALWDRPKTWGESVPTIESIPTVIELIDRDDIIAILVEKARHSYSRPPVYNPPDDPEVIAIDRELSAQRGNEWASRAEAELRKAIEATRYVLASSRLSAVRNLRDKHLAHSLASTHRETKRGPIPPMKYGDETALIEESVPIIEGLYRWVYGSSFSIRDSQDIDRKNAEALWKGCKFNVRR
jgi:hypothetical protein